jgi:hypothetical protein
MMGFNRLPLLIGLGLVACGGGEDPVAPGPSTGGNSTGNQPSTAGTTSSAGTGGSLPGQAGSSSTAGTTSQAGMAGTGTGGAGTGTAGAGGSTSGGTATGGGGAGGGPGAIMVTVQPGLHSHTTGTPARPAAIDNRLPKVMGKLIVNLDVDDGNINDYAVKHGFHVYGAKLPLHCDIAESKDDYAGKGRDFNGNCRLETFDGMEHEPSVNIAAADAVASKVKAALTDLAAKYSDEGWGYFLDGGGNVRWEDVGITGYSHGATSAIRWSKKIKLWRAVARSGPRDNICGSAYKGQTCPDSAVSSWLTEQSVTPVANVFSLGGMGDTQYGDFVYANDKLMLPGAPTDVTAAAPPDGANRLYISGGHDDFTNKSFWPVFDKIYAMPAENVTYANSH